MKFTDIFIQRPVIAIVICLLILLAGFQAGNSLSVRQFPRSDVARITINTVYVGASAELVRGFITTPIERAIASAEGIDYIDSESAMNRSTIRAHLRLNYDPLRAMTEINAKVNQVRGDLPPEAEVPSITIEAADSEFAAAYLSFNSEILDQNQITDFLTRSVQPRLTAISGVQKAEALGGRVFAMRIWIKHDRLAALQVTPLEVRQALQRNNVQAAIGQTRGSYTQVNLRADTDLNSVEDFENIVVRQTDSGTIRLRDLADVQLGAEDYNTEVRFSGETAVFLGVWVAPNANSLSVMQRVNAEMAAIQKELPTGLSAVVAYDATKYIDASITEVLTTLTETLLIIVVVIFLFLGFSRSVLIPVVAIPLSLIGALFIMQLFGFSLNLLTLLSIVLSVGLVVDDAIVMVENIERHIQAGKPPFAASIIAARELAGPILAMTVTLVSVYLPIGLQGGLTGTLFREFAITLAGAVTISAIVAITLSPMLGSRMLKPHRTLNAPLGKIFDRFQTYYSGRLAQTLRHRPAIYIVWVGIALLCFPLYLFSAKELAPLEDQGVIFGIVESPANATVDQASFYAAAVNDIFMAVPETDFTFQLTFPTGGFSGLVTKPWEERERSVFEIQPELQEKLGAIPGVRIFPITPPSLPGGGNFPVEFVVAGTAPAKDIYDYALQLQEVANNSGKFNFTMLDMKVDQPDYLLNIDREKVADLGLDLQTVTQDLGTLLGGGYVNRFNMAGQSYKVIPQVKRTARLTPDDLQELYISGPKGELIRLDQVATLSHSTAPRTIHRMQQRNAVKLSGDTHLPLGEALAFLEQEAAKILPQGYSIDYTGESRQLKREGNTFLPAFLLALTMIFLVLAAQYNSFRDPVVILAGSVPLAVFGALIFTFIKMPMPMPMPFFTDSFSTTLNIYSQVGLVTLMGLIARNGILVVEFANRLQEEGKSKLEAVHQAAVVRLRPVLMTSIATVAGHMPLIFADGPGAGARIAIGLVLVFGMAIGTVLTLFVLPSVYVLVAKDHQQEQARRAELQAQL